MVALKLFPLMQNKNDKNYILERNSKGLENTLFSIVIYWSKLDRTHLYPCRKNIYINVIVYDLEEHLFVGNRPWGACHWATCLFDCQLLILIIRSDFLFSILLTKRGSHFLRGFGSSGNPSLTKTTSLLRKSLNISRLVGCAKLHTWI